MKWQTGLKIADHIDKAGINYKSGLVFMGSCFTNNVGQRMAQCKFTALINSLGISYNPISLNKHVQYLCGNRVLDEEAFFETDKGYVHYDFHSDLSKQIKIESIKGIDKLITDGHKTLKKASHIFISYGTAIVYEEKENEKKPRTRIDRIVNNCHKQLPKNFNKTILSFKEVSDAIEETIISLKKLNAELKVIFTLSPVRHIKNGLINDRRSKSLLHAAIHNQVDNYEHCFYFPSYEILVDELRDYRFYKADMFHPSPQTIEYIWSKFGESFFDQKTKDKLKTIESILLQINHKAHNPQSASYLDFREKLLGLIIEMQKEGFDFSSEIKILEEEISAISSNEVSGP